LKCAGEHLFRCSDLKSGGKSSENDYGLHIAAINRELISARVPAPARVKANALRDSNTIYGSVLKKTGFEDSG
jgi:hypothetical protein